MQTINLKDMQPGQELTLDLIVQVSKYGFITAYNYLPDGSVKIADVQITVTVPEGFNPIAEAVAAVDREIASVRDEANKKIAPLQKQKDELLQLTYGGQEILDPEQPE